MFSWFSPPVCCKDKLTLGRKHHRRYRLGSSMLVTVGLTLAGVIPVDLTITLGCDVILSAWLLRACWACRRCHGKPWASQARWHDGPLLRIRGDAKWVEGSEAVPGHKDHHGGEVTVTETRTPME